MYYLKKDILLQEYILLDDYKDEQREISLFKDDIVEILDISKPEKWLVRSKYKNLNQVCYIPPILLEHVEKGATELMDMEYQKRFSRVRKQNSSESNKKSEVNDNMNNNKQATTASTNDINTIYTKFAKFPNANKEDNLPTDSEQQQQSNFNHNNENNLESNTQTTIEHNFITDKTGKYFFKNISFFLRVVCQQVEAKVS